MTNLLNNRLNEAFGQLIGGNLYSFDDDIDSSFQFFKDSSYPKVDIIDHENSLDIILEATGFKNSEVSAEVEGDTLVVLGEGSEKEIPENSKYLRKEIKSKSFKRLFKLPDYCTKTKITAKFENGLLCISVPKKKPEKPKKVKIL